MSWQQSCSSQIQLLFLVKRFLIQPITCWETSFAESYGVVRFSSSWWFSRRISVWLWRRSGGTQLSSLTSTTRPSTRSERLFTSRLCGCGQRSCVVPLCSKLHTFLRIRWTYDVSGSFTGVNSRSAVLWVSFKSFWKWYFQAWLCCLCSYTWFTRQASPRSPRLRAGLKFAVKWRGW